MVIAWFQKADDLSSELWLVLFAPCLLLLWIWLVVGRDTGRPYIQEIRRRYRCYYLVRSWSDHPIGTRNSGAADGVLGIGREPQFSFTARTPFLSKQRIVGPHGFAGLKSWRSAVSTSRSISSVVFMPSHLGGVLSGSSLQTSLAPAAANRKSRTASHKPQAHDEQP